MSVQISKYYFGYYGFAKIARDSSSRVLGIRNDTISGVLHGRRENGILTLFSLLPVIP
jgi:hypothetical protein